MESQAPAHLGAYANLGAFIKYRDHTLIEEPLRPSYLATEGRDAASMTPSRVVGDVIGQVGYWQITALSNSEPQRLMLIYLITEESKAAHSTADFRKLLIAPAKQKHDYPVGEIIIIAPESMIKKKHPLETMQEFRKKNLGTLYNIYPYYIFASVVPEQPIVPKHEVMNPLEAQQFLNKFYFKRSQLGKIFTKSDPAAIWCGARPGDYVRIWRVSETAVTETPDIRLAV